MRWSADGEPGALSVIVVDMPVRQAYEGMKAHPYCGNGWLVDGQYDAYDDSFVVKYSLSHRPRRTASDRPRSLLGAR